MPGVASKVKAMGAASAVTAVFMGLVAIFLPEYYERVPPGFEAGLACVIGTLAGYFKKETVLVDVVENKGA
jgi:hypothetical protein